MFSAKRKLIQDIKNAFNMSSKKLGNIQNQLDLNIESSNLKTVVFKLSLNKKGDASDTNRNLVCFSNTIFSSTNSMTNFTKLFTKYLYKNNKKTSFKLSPLSAISNAKSEIIKWGEKYDKTREKVKKNFDDVKQFVKSISTIKKVEDFKLNKFEDKINNFKSKNVIDFYSESTLKKDLESYVKSMDEELDEESLKKFLEIIEEEMECSIKKYFPGLDL